MTDIKQISPQGQKWLSRLTAIAKPPKSLRYKGILPDDAPTVAIVGSRKPTLYGKGVTLKLAAELAARGVIIVSGLALGHDALAHRGALDGGGITIGVLGNGLNKIYPSSNQSLASEILASSGAIISEFAPDFPVYKQNFLQRNRLISGLADVVIVVEAATRSGSLNTAMHALEQNKELMAVPGNITSPLSAGTNRLIAQGAAPVLSVDDVLEKLGIKANKKSRRSKSAPVGGSPAQNLILKLLKNGVSDGDELIVQSGLSASDYNQALTMLEIDGLVRPLGANQWAIK
ncbi:MAG: DNA-processing protein DprA [Candidatus Nomurabacteria bacterium]|jgi:DNA processing protein|nr:DNA-processing protein DprA [Candidatus Nomurabacteria bacterium]